MGIPVCPCVVVDNVKSVLLRKWLSDVLKLELSFTYLTTSQTFERPLKKFLKKVFANLSHLERKNGTINILVCLAWFYVSVFCERSDSFWGTLGGHSRDLLEMSKKRHRRTQMDRQRTPMSIELEHCLSFSGFCRSQQINNVNKLNIDICKCSNVNIIFLCVLCHVCEWLACLMLLLLAAWYIYASCHAIMYICMIFSPFDRRHRNECHEHSFFCFVLLLTYPL